MLVAVWDKFLGANTKVHPKLLADGLGVDAQNLRLGHGDLRGWNAANTVVTTGGATPLISAYRMGRSIVSDTSTWIQWTVDVDVVRSLIANDSSEEIYYTGDGAPKLTDNVIGLPASPSPAAWRTLGIPKPSSMMSAALLVEGTGSNENRVYLDTFINDKNRESAPGVARTFTCKAGSTVTLSSLAAAPGGNHGIDRRRIYCSTDGGDYLLVVEQGVGLTTATDSLARGSVLQSGGDVSKPAWLEPPSTLKGLVELWNGMIGGFFGKSYCVCVPYKPWAWPIEYQEVVMHDIVGSATWQSNWLLCTTAQPVLVTGSSPESLSDQPLPIYQACVSKRSVVGVGHGVCWASPEGLVYFGDRGYRILTGDHLTTSQWQALVPSSIIGARFENYYLGFYNDGGGLKGFCIDTLNPSGVVWLTQGARGVFFDPLSARLYLQDTSNVIRRWDSGSSLPTTFKTAVKRHPYPVNPGAAMIVSDSPISAAVTLWANILQSNGTYTWTQVFSRTVVSGEPFALPSGYLAQDFQSQIVTTAPIQALMVAEDVTDII